MSQLVRLACVQAEPEWLDLQAGVDKAIRLIKEAGEKKVNILGFPEVFIPGYPISIWTESVISNSKILLKYRQNSLSRDSPEMRKILDAVKEAGIYVVLGYSERVNNSFYIAQSFISPAGTIINHRRKIKPTGVERNVWGDAGPEGLNTTVETEFGRLGALCCAEHVMPLLRMHEYTQGAQMHIASWPMTWEAHRLGTYKAPGHEDYNGDLHASRFMSREGNLFVAVATQVLTPKNYERVGLNEGVDVAKKAVGCGGHSMIYDPHGKPLVHAIPEDEEGILYADINLDEALGRAMLIDIVGHSSRPDLLSLNVNTPPPLTSLSNPQ
ncbi:carbon-nitrogen hydrolase [Rhizodiscina lignyota]|uniref:nitrilase n=1 Tax=Rhizodiscina lignyota TaxID=1504668 RepID=A0A9P4I7D3_9PEZI|nr:carbon-nitrogen hydrolase [Rhizodiscina lignyota]